MSAIYWPVVLTPGDCEDGEFGGIKIDRGNPRIRRKPAPVPLCPPQIPLKLLFGYPHRVRWYARCPLRLHLYNFLANSESLHLFLSFTVHLQLTVNLI
jgi:hypothetical protein